MLKKLSVKEVSGEQREFAERTANLICREACRNDCSSGDTYVVCLTGNLNDEVSFGC